MTSFDPLRPAFLRKASSPSSSKSIVIGVPTVKRPVESYLFQTISNLIDNMSPDEKVISLIVVFIAEVDRDYVESQAAQLEEQFHKEIGSGLLEIISPPSTYYPDWNETTPSLGDTIERTRWRTKQNLDFAYLMMYCQPRATYYVQLEDDVLSKPNFPSKMLSFALKQTATKPDWFLLDFCQLGFIGKMFKSRDLSSFTLMFLIFQHDKPVDWILSEYSKMKYCRQDKDYKDCRRQLSSKWLFFRPSLFQHIGTHSSLKGKVQKLRDKNFGRLTLFRPHTLDNPPAIAFTTLRVYKDFSIERAYEGSTYFWGFSPIQSDFISFNFTDANKPTLESFLFRSGNSEHPEDMLPMKSTVEILPETDPFSSSSLEPSRYSLVVAENNDTNARLNSTQKVLPSGTVIERNPDGYYTVGYFKLNGVAEGIVPSEFGPLHSLRIRIHTDSDRWVILSEVCSSTNYFDGCSNSIFFII